MSTQYETDRPSPKVENFRLFQKRLEVYSRHFSQLNTKNAGDETPTKRRSWHIPTSLTAKVFNTWTIDDVRDLDLVWQHIAPELFGELRQQYNTVLSQQTVEDPDDTCRASILSVVNNFVDQLHRSGRYDMETIDFLVVHQIARFRSLSPRVRR